jgi:hypothetical protein
MVETMVETAGAISPAIIYIYIRSKAIRNGRGTLQCSLRGNSSLLHHIGFRHCTRDAIAAEILSGRQTRIRDTNDYAAQ